MSSAYQRWLTYLPAALVATGIAVLSLSEQTPDYLPSSVSDKLLHAIAYCILAFTLVFALEFRRASRVLHYVYAFLLTIAYGALIELLQYFCTATRTAEWGDFCADVMGALVGVLLGLVFYRK
jgi:VanZ family protein